MESAQQLQMVVAEVQAARQQVASLNAQVRELEGTVAAVKEQPEDMALHRQMGTILVEVKDREQLLSDLETTLTQMKSAVETMAKRDAELVSTYEKVKQSLERLRKLRKEVQGKRKLLLDSKTGVFQGKDIGVVQYL